MSYLLWATLVGFQLLRHIVFRHQLVSFQFSFLLVCFVWLLFRCLWFVVDWSSTGSLTVALIVLAPEVCQIATFSLLVLYIAKLVHRRRWVEVRAGLFTCYVMSVSIMIVVAIFFAGLYDSQSQGGSGQQGLDQMYYFTSGTYFGALVAVAACTCIYLPIVITAMGAFICTSHLTFLSLFPLPAARRLHPQAQLVAESDDARHFVYLGIDRRRVCRVSESQCV